ETDEPSDFLDLVHELRAGESSSYTLRDTPIFTCISTSVRRALDALDGHGATAVRDLSGQALNAEAIVSASVQRPAEFHGPEPPSPSARTDERAQRRQRHHLPGRGGRGLRRAPRPP